MIIQCLTTKYFKSEEFKAFAVTLRESIQATPMPANVLMQQVVPIIEEQLLAGRTEVSRLYTLMLDKTQSSSDIFSDLRELVSSSPAHNEAVNRLNREQIRHTFSQVGHSITSSASTDDENPEIQCSD
jgi:hypothetical protein